MIFFFLFALEGKYKVQEWTWLPGSEARVQTAGTITLSLNKNDSLKYPVILLHTHSLHLIFL